MSDDDVFHSVSMVMNVDPAEIAKIVHDYINRGIVSDYDRLNCPKPPIYIGPVKIKTLKERLEETKMKATSTETFHDIIAVDFELQTFPNPDVQDKFILSATNRDDIFCFIFEGPYIADACRKAGLFTNWEKDQKIKGLEKENKKILDTNRKLQEKIFRLEELKTPTIENFADEEPSSRSDILDRAKKCVCGQREQDYGTPESNFQLIADLWNDYLKKERLGRSKAVVDAVDVSMMMALMKIARIRNGGGSGDSFVDLAGYAACGGEIWAEEKKKKDQN